MPLGWRIRSELLKGCYEAGMKLTEIGVAEVSDAGCGAVLMYYSLRRPLYVFCDLTNLSNAPITVTALRAAQQRTSEINPRKLQAFRDHS
jgi:hypothetical protein